MVITDENKGTLLEDSLATQLEQAVNQQSTWNQAEESSSQLTQALQDEETTPLSAMSGISASAGEMSAGSLDFLDESNVSTSWLPKTEIKNYNTPFLYATVGIGVSAILAAICGMFIWYFHAKALPNTEVPHEYVQTTSDLYNEYGQTLGLFDLAQYDNTDFSVDGKNRAKNLISANRLNYPQKKDLLQSAVSTFGAKIIDTKMEIKTITDQLNKDGFFPEELVSILKENDAVGSIQRSLLSLEVVKFSSAMKVFSLMDVFLSSLSNELGYPKAEVKSRLDQLLARWENDIKNYLYYCYNNPYEPANCSIIGDFDTYYRLYRAGEAFDTTFFKTIMDHIDRKLENAQLPSFSITFNDFNSKENKISFSVEVNTLKEDEYALIRQGIKSPHVFIVSELIKLLKQSTFIVGSAIDIKAMQVEEKEEEFWDVVYKYHSSSNNFELPIQKTTQREIFDYVDSFKSLLSEEEEPQTTTGGGILDQISAFAGGLLSGADNVLTGGFIDGGSANQTITTGTLSITGVRS